MKFIISTILFLSVIKSLQITPLNLKISKAYLNDRDHIIIFLKEFIEVFHSYEDIYRSYLSEVDFKVYAEYIKKLENSLSKITDENSKEISDMIDDCIDEIDDAIDDYNDNPTKENFTIAIKLFERMFDKLFKILSVTSTNNMKVTLY